MLLKLKMTFRKEISLGMLTQATFRCALKTDICHDDYLSLLAVGIGNKVGIMTTIDFQWATRMRISMTGGHDCCISSA